MAMDRASFRDRMVRLRAAVSWPVRRPDGFWSYEAMNEAVSGSESIGNVVAAAYAAINLITGKLVGLPRHVVDADGTVVDHPLSALFERPYAFLDGYLGWEFPIRRWATHGNGYFMVRRSRRFGGAPVELVPAVEGGAQYRSNGQVEYTLTPLGYHLNNYSRTTVAGRDVVALHWYGFDGLTSPSPIGYAAQSAIRQIRAITAYHPRKITRAKRSGAALAIREDVREMPTPEQLTEWRETLNAGLNSKPDEIPLLPPGMEPAQLFSLSEADIRTVEILRWAVEDIARVWNVAPARLAQQAGGGAGVRTQTFREQMTDLEVITIKPLADRLDAALRVLLSAKERMDGLRVWTDTSDIGKGTLADKIEMLDRLVARSGAATIDEGRKEVMGWQPLPNGEGDKVYSPKGSPEQGGQQGDMGGDGGEA